MRVWMVLLGEGRRQAIKKRDEKQTRDGRPHRMSAAQISGTTCQQISRHLSLTKWSPINQ